jgi:hypothetical protein
MKTFVDTPILMNYNNLLLWSIHYISHLYKRSISKHLESINNTKTASR